jgi:hypothetical protein
MSAYLGDITLGDTLDHKFTSVDTSGLPTALVGGVISAYVDNSATEITAGVTLTASFDGRTGLNHVRVVASSGNGFATGTNVQLIITTGTVSGASVVGYVIGLFSIGKRTPLDSAGLATLLTNVNTLLTRLGVPSDLASGATIAQNLVDIENQTDDIGVAGAGLSAVPGISNLSRLDVNVSSRAVPGDAMALTSGERTTLAGVIWSVLTSALTTASSIGKLLVDNINATISSRSSHTAADCWAVATRTLTSYGTLTTDVATAVWSAGTRTLTSFGTLTTDTAAAVWAYATRTLTTYGTLTTDAAAAVWAYATRTLTAFGFTVNTSPNGTETASKGILDKLDTALELDGAVYRYTTNALEQAPTPATAADLWATPLPGSYPAGSAGNIVGTRLDVPVSSVGGGGSVTLAPGQATAIADEVLKRDWTLISGEAHESLLNGARFLRNHWEVTLDGVLIVYKENGSTVAWQRTVGIDPNAKPVVSVT